MVKLVANRIISYPGTQLYIFDINHFYLQTHLPHLEYARIKLSDIPEEFTQEYNLLEYVHDGWIYLEIRGGIYGLPQAGMLTNKLLETCLNAAGY